jgi:hypothetical protein
VIYVVAYLVAGTAIVAVIRAAWRQASDADRREKALDAANKD